MENSNKVIIYLLIFITILGTILGIRIFIGNKNTEIVNVNNITSNVENNTIANDINNNFNNTENNIAENGGWKIFSGSMGKIIIIAIIDLVVMLIVIPLLLKRFELWVCTTIMTIYKLIISAFSINLLSGGILVFILMVAIVFAIYYALLWIINKFLLDTNPIVYFISLVFISRVLAWVSNFLLAQIISLLI